MKPQTVPDGTPMPSPPPPPPPPPPPRPTGPAGPGPGRFTDEYLKVAEVAELWHSDPETVYHAIYDGELPWIDCRRKGASRARIRIRRSAADQYMKDREHPARSAA